MTSEGKALAELIYDEPQKIGHLIGFKDLTELHGKWIRAFLFGTQDVTLLSHRGSYKTSCLSLFLALHAVLDPNHNIMFFRKTDGDVTEVINQTQKILRSDVLEKISQVMHQREFRIVKDTASEIHTDLCDSIRGTSQIVGLGINTSITGKHADIVVTDDIVNIRDRISRAERERTKMQYMELQNIRNRGGRFINTGTPWHKDDAISIMPNVHRYDCYSTGLISRDTLEDLRQSMSDSLFSANYELKHIADGDMMFKDPKFTNDQELIYGGVAHIDAAYGGNDSTAFTIMHELSDGRIIGFGKLWHRHVDDCLPMIGAYHERFRTGSLSCEKNADKGYLTKELVNLGYTVNQYNESMNKFVKISTYLRKHWGQIEWLEETDPDYINEILDYNEFTDNDHSPDSAASLLRQMETAVHYNDALTGGI